MSGLDSGIGDPDNSLRFQNLGIIIMTGLSIQMFIQKLSKQCEQLYMVCINVHLWIIASKFIVLHIEKITCEYWIKVVQCAIKRGAFSHSK